MSIRYTLRRLNESECTIDNLKEYELASIKPSGRVVIRLGDQIINLVNAADNGAIEASRLWAVSEDSPDGEDDEESPTGKTMSSRSWALTMIDSANEALTRVNNVLNTAESTLTAAQTAASSATASAQQASLIEQRINTKISEANTAAQQINSDITLINQKLAQAENTLQQSTTLLDRLIDITDADEVRY